MTTHDTPEAALAAALHSYGPCALSGCNHLLLGYCEHDASAILAALDGEIAPRGTSATARGLLVTARSQEAEIARLRAALAWAMDKIECQVGDTCYGEFVCIGHAALAPSER